MEKTQAGSRRYPRNSERAQDDRAVKWWAVDGKLLLNPGKKAVYSSILPCPRVCHRQTLMSGWVNVSTGNIVSSAMVARGMDKQPSALRYTDIHRILPMSWEWLA